MCHVDKKLTNDRAHIRNFGIKDGDQVCAIGQLLCFSSKKCVSRNPGYEFFQLLHFWITMHMSTLWHCICLFKDRGGWMTAALLMRICSTLSCSSFRRIWISLFKHPTLPNPYFILFIFAFLYCITSVLTCACVCLSYLKFMFEPLILRLR